MGFKCHGVNSRNINILINKYIKTCSSWYWLMKDCIYQTHIYVEFWKMSNEDCKEEHLRDAVTFECFDDD